VDKELEQFQADLLKSVKEVENQQGARSTTIAISPITHGNLLYSGDGITLPNHIS